VSPKKGSALVLVGTIKGAFVLNSDPSRERWEVSGPHFPGRVVYSMAYDGRRWRQRIWSSSTHFAFGHPRHPDTAYIFPLEREKRCSPDGKLRVFRTRDTGNSWQPLSKGFPDEPAYETVLRDGLNTDTLKPAGIYFGTRSGKVCGSPDEGESRSLILQGVPAITCVKAAAV